MKEEESEWWCHRLTAIVLTPRSPPLPAQGAPNSPSSSTRVPGTGVWGRDLEERGARPASDPAKLLVLAGQAERGNGKGGQLKSLKGQGGQAGEP